MSNIKSTPLEAEHRAAGATLTEFGGWNMPLRYTSDLAEHRAVREAAGLFDLSHMGEIHLEGTGAAAALDHALVGSASGIAVGRARYSMLCAADGTVLDDLIVYRLADHHFLVVANAGNTAVVLRELAERVRNHAALVTDRTATTALVAIQGPRAEQITAALVTEPDTLRALRYYAAAPLMLTTGVGVLVARTGYTGEDGFEVFVPAEHARTLWHSALAAGEPHGLVRAGLAARDSLRLEAGMPLYGHELDATTTPFDAGLGRVVRFDKTDERGAPIDFVGRAALAARRDAAPERVLVGLRAQGRRSARAGYDVVTDGGARVGTVTSAAPSPTLGCPIALAYVLPDVAAEGTALAVDVRGRAEPFTVVPLPFYRRATA